MAERLSIYQPRAPRYVLLPHDNKILRIKRRSAEVVSDGMEIVNVSKSGMAFRHQSAKPPKVGESIVIQFAVPGREQMACHAEVVRIDQDLIALRFTALNLEQRLNLSWGLQKSFNAIKEYHQFHQIRQTALIAFHYSDLILKLGLVMALWIFCVFSLGITDVSSTW